MPFLVAWTDRGWARRSSRSPGRSYGLLARAAYQVRGIGAQMRAAVLALAFDRDTWRSRDRPEVEVAGLEACRQWFGGA